jgi:hypothetical protein
MINSILERYPVTYNGQPLCYAALAAQKNYYSLYLMSVYQDSKEEGSLREAFRQAGKKLDMGKCCIRFRSLDDLPLDAIGREVGSVSVDEHIARTKPAGSRRSRLEPPEEAKLKSSGSRPWRSAGVPACTMCDEPVGSVRPASGFSLAVDAQWIQSAESVDNRTMPSLPAERVGVLSRLILSGVFSASLVRF